MSLIEWAASHRALAITAIWFCVVTIALYLGFVIPEYRRMKKDIEDEERSREAGKRWGAK